MVVVDENEDMCLVEEGFGVFSNNPQDFGDKEKSKTTNVAELLNEIKFSRKKKSTPFIAYSHMVTTPCFPHLPHTLKKHDKKLVHLPPL